MSTVSSNNFDCEAPRTADLPFSPDLEPWSDEEAAETTKKEDDSIEEKDVDGRERGAEEVQREKGTAEVYETPAAEPGKLDRQSMHGATAAVPVRKAASLDLNLDPFPNYGQHGSLSSSIAKSPIDITLETGLDRVGKDWCSAGGTTERLGAIAFGHDWTSPEDVTHMTGSTTTKCPGTMALAFVALLLVFPPTCLLVSPSLHALMHTPKALLFHCSGFRFTRCALCCNI